MLEAIVEGVGQSGETVTLGYAGETVPPAKKRTAKKELNALLLGLGLGLSSSAELTNLFLEELRELYIFLSNTPTHTPQAMTVPSMAFASSSRVGLAPANPFWSTLPLSATT